MNTVLTNTSEGDYPQVLICEIVLKQRDRGLGLGASGNKSMIPVPPTNRNVVADALISLLVLQESQIR